MFCDILLYLCLRTQFVMLLYGLLGNLSSVAPVDFFILFFKISLECFVSVVLMMATRQR